MSACPMWAAGAKFGWARSIAGADWPVKYGYFVSWACVRCYNFFFQKTWSSPEKILIKMRVKKLLEMESQVAVAVFKVGRGWLFGRQKMLTTSKHLPRRQSKISTPTS